MSAHPLIPDVHETACFLAAFEWGAQFGLATLDDRSDNPRLALRLYGDLNESIRLTGPKRGQLCSTIRMLTFMQSLGAGVFFTVQAIDGGGAREQHINGIRALIADADTDVQLACLGQFIAITGLEPSITVTSGGLTASGAEKVHAYWLVSDCPVAAFPELQRLLLSRTGTDPAVGDLARVMRLPGFWHQKNGPRQTRIRSITGVVHYYSEFVDRINRAPQVCDPQLRRGAIGNRTRYRGSMRRSNSGSTTARLRILLDRNGGLVTPAVHALLREAVAPTEGAPGNRHATLLSIAARCVQICWPDADIRQLVLPVINAEWADGDWTEHLDSALSWVRKREAAAFAAAPRANWPGRSSCVSGNGRRASR